MAFWGCATDEHHGDHIQPPSPINQPIKYGEDSREASPFEGESYHTHRYSESYHTDSMITSCHHKHNFFPQQKKRQYAGWNEYRG